MTQNLAVSDWIIEELINLGVTHFVVSPGSRSTPLTVAVARNPKADTTIHFDERGAAYFALGHAKATGQPAVLICTSGTAVANYFPAVVEASMDNISLIVLSADRPPELIDVGANQAIFQENIYGSYPRLFKNLSPPDTKTTIEQIQETITETYAAAIGSRPGPVHLNCQFREPLLPDSTGVKHPIPPVPCPSTPLGMTKQEIDPIEDDIDILFTLSISDEQLHLIKKKIEGYQRGIIIVGRSVDPQYDEAILSLANTLNWPIFPDIQSKLRFRKHANLINQFDLTLLKDSSLEQKPEMVLHLGGAFTSKRLLNFLDDSEIYYVAVKATPECIDPNHQVDVAIQTNIGDLCKSIEVSNTNNNGMWLKAWQKTEGEVSETITDLLESMSILSEPAVSYQLSRSIPRDHSLMLANSMAIREMEMFGTIHDFEGRVIANRGSSGIDGSLATAAGYQIGSEKPLTLLIGDLAALHDLNSLSLVKNTPQPMIIILINNNGGGIFNFLPVRTETDVFEAFFGTPHGWTFEKAAEMFNLSYAHPKDMQEFKLKYSQAVKESRSMIIEVNTDRDENHTLHQRIFKTIRES